MDNDIIISKLNEVYAKITCEKHIAQELSEFFTFMVPGYQFVPAFRNRIWDGKIRLYNLQTSQLYLGLLDYVETFCESRGYTLENELNIEDESCSDKTLKRINRGHTFAQSVNAIKMTAERNLKAGIHLIFGLPGETQDDMMSEAAIISALPIHSLKIHQLQVVKNTKMEILYNENPNDFISFTRHEYIDLVISFVENLNPDIIIDRFAGEVPPRFLSGPSIMEDARWGFIRNDQLIQMIEKRMAEKDTWQGKFYRNG